MNLIEIFSKPTESSDSKPTHLHGDSELWTANFPSEKFPYSCTCHTDPNKQLAREIYTTNGTNSRPINPENFDTPSDIENLFFELQTWKQETKDARIWLVQTQSHQDPKIRSLNLQDQASFFTLPFLAKSIYQAQNDPQIQIRVTRIPRKPGSSPLI